MLDLERGRGEGVCRRQGSGGWWGGGRGGLRVGQWPENLLGVGKEARVNSSIGGRGLG